MIDPSRWWLTAAFHLHVKYLQEYHKVQSLVPLSFCYSYINDISEGIHSQIKLFADDCLVYRNVQTSTDQQILQQDLNTLMKWADKWQMKFNIKKCKSQTIVIKSTV